MAFYDAGSFSGGVSNSVMSQGIGYVGFNWFSSMPAFIADSQFEPNFRHFDFFVRQDPPDQELIERVWKVDPGEAHWNMATIWGGNMRTNPVLMTTAITAMWTNYFYCKVNGRPMALWRWSMASALGYSFIYHNVCKWMMREKHFQRDFQRNQGYAQEEMRRTREEHRVKVALYEQQFVNDPVAEFRIKEWQVSKRWN
jgi:hypothetical protein